jgi:hypothetical protein
LSVLSSQDLEECLPLHLKGKLTLLIHTQHDCPLSSLPSGVSPLSTATAEWPTPSPQAHSDQYERIGASHLNSSFYFSKVFMSISSLKRSSDCSVRAQGPSPNSTPPPVTPHLCVQAQRIHHNVTEHVQRSQDGER